MDLLVLVRHGQAESAATDSARPLSAVGRDQVRSVAVGLKSRGVRPGIVVHSPKLRAIQTAGILAAELGGKMQETSHVAPDSDPDILIEDLATLEGTVVVASHLPFLPALTQTLIGHALAFGPASAVAIENGDDGYVLAWKEGPHYEE